MDFRIGSGNDIHRLVPGRTLLLGGVEVASEFGAEGHSDGDALLHSITDAILGALALGDIGSHFPDSDDRWKGADSSRFLTAAIEEARTRGYSVANVDSTISLERPKLRPQIDEMRTRIAKIVGVEPDAVSVKAKTSEGLDAVGRGEAVRADAVVLLARS